jgi:hypothetical protein
MVADVIGHGALPKDLYVTRGWIRRTNIVAHKIVRGRPFRQHFRKSFRLSVFLLPVSTIWDSSNERVGGVAFVGCVYQVKRQMSYMSCSDRAGAVRLAFEVRTM